MTRAAAYYRVSSERQAHEDRNSLPLQRAAFVRRCHERGYEVAGEYSDVMSGRKRARPGYQALLAAARSGACDVIVVTYLDRFGRNDREITMRVLELQDAGIEVEPTEETIPDFITLVLTAWKAGQEVERTTKRTSDGIFAAAARGVAIGKAPFGYRHRWDLDADDRRVNHRFEVYEPEATLVRWAFEQYAYHNASLRSLCFALAQRTGPHKNGHWVPREVVQLLVRERYTGVWTYSRRATATHEAVEVRLPGAIPAIVTRELFEAVQERRRTKAALPAGRTQSSTFLLSGIARCAHCGGPLHGSTVRQPRAGGRIGEYRTYKCGWHTRYRGRCAFPNAHPVHALDDAVLAYLEDIAGNVVAVREQVGERANEAHRALGEVKQALAEIESRFVRNMRLFDSGALADEAQLATFNRASAEEKRRLTAERDRLLEQIAAVGARQREVARLPEELPVILNPATPLADRKTLIQKYVTKVEGFEGHDVPRIYLRFFE